MPLRIVLFEMNPYDLIKCFRPLSGIYRVKFFQNDALNLC